MIKKENTRKEIIEALNWRYATKIFDKNKKIEKEDIYAILESARLSPSSLGLEMWKFLVIEDPEIRKRIREYSFDQSKMTDASHLILITCRTDIEENILNERLERMSKIQNKKIEELDGFKKMVSSTIESKAKNNTLESWVNAQSYIPLGIMTETAALLQIDSCPIEGFINEKIDELLNLKEKNLKSVSMLALGYRGDDLEEKRVKVRRNFNEVIEII